VAGIIVASMTSLSPTLGTVALGVLAVIILGGLDSIAGAIVAGLIVGWLESITVAFIGGQARDLVPYLVVLVILMVRPYGLFGTHDIERL
jgi:branched-chain amino acid transport system permease protein